MKSLRTCILLVCANFYALGLMAQDHEKVPLNEPDYNKPHLFKSLPAQINVDADRLAAALFTKETGNTVAIPVTTGFSVEGVVVSTASLYENSLQSVVLRLTNYPGANFSLSRYTDPSNGKVSYTARIISKAHGDLYELELKDGQYRLVKKDFYVLVNE